MTKPAFDYSTGEVPDCELPPNVTQPTRRIAHRWADSVQSEPVEWLWHGYIPRTGMTFLDGDPEAGKTCCALDLIARVTTGEPMPGEACHGRREPAVAAILAKEDRYENTIRPRLEAAGADLSRVAFIDEVEVATEQKTHREFITFPKHTDEMASFLEQTHAKLLLVDPYDNHIDDGLNTSSSADMRRCFMPIIEAASALGCALLVIRHFGKKDYGNAKHKGLGSIGLTGMARSNLAAVDDGQGGFIFGRIKGNLTRQPDSLVYQIASWDEDKAIPVLKWCGTSDRSVNEAAVSNNRKARTTKADQMTEVLDALLVDGPVPVSECLRALEAIGISERSFKRYKTECGFESFKSAEFQGQWVLRKAADPETAKGANTSTDVPKGAKF